MTKKIIIILQPNTSPFENLRESQKESLWKGLRKSVRKSLKESPLRQQGS